MTRHSGVMGGEDAAWRPPAPISGPATGPTTGPTPNSPPAAPPGSAGPAGATESLTGYDHLVEVGRGGDSVVYRARDVAMDRDVAIKVLQTDDERAVARFRREIAITVRLGRQHPHIVNILATGTTASGHPAIVMDFYEAGSLHDRLRSHGPLPVEEVVTIGAVLADALAFAHAHGVLHRDVKPQNVLILPTSWVLADFGIARLVDSEHTSSVETFTYRHASPQILDGAPPTEADDVWSLGSTLYTLVDGRPPFAGDDPDDDSALAYLRRARTEPHRPLAGPGVQRLAAVIDGCLAKDVTQRWASAAELRDAIAALRVTAWQPGAASVGSAAAEQLHSVPQPPAGAPAPTPAADPVALSVLAHAPGRVEDEPPTSTRPPETTDDPAAVPASRDLRREPEPETRAPDRTPPERGRRRWILVGLGVAALVVGLVLGVLGSVLRDDEPEDTAAGPAAGDVAEPIESLSASPVESGDPQVRRANPRLAFDIIDIETDGTSLTLEWNDPTEGEGRFALSEVVPDERFVYKFPPGQTEATVPYVIPQGQRTCFTMTVHLATNDIGYAKPRCITP